MRKHIAPLAAFALAAVTASASFGEDSPALAYQACMSSADARYADDTAKCQGQRPDRAQACLVRAADTRTRSKIGCEQKLARANELIAARQREQQQRAQARAPR